MFRENAFIRAHPWPLFIELCPLHEALILSSSQKLLDPILQKRKTKAPRNKGHLSKKCHGGSARGPTQVSLTPKPVHVHRPHAMSQMPRVY